MGRIKYYLILMLATFSAPAISQTQKGSLLVRGSMALSFDNVKEKNNNVTEDIGNFNTAEIDVSAGYFIMDGIAIGGNLTNTWESFKDVDNNRQSYRATSIGPFGRWYSALGPFFHAEIGIGGGVTKIKPENEDEISFTFGQRRLGLGVGYPFFVGNKVSVEPLLLFRSLTEVRESPVGEDVKDKYRGLQFQVGLVYYIF